MIARKSLLIVMSQFFARFLGWIALVILAKMWGDSAPETLGIIGFAMAFVALFTFIGDLGFTSAHVKRLSEGNNTGECIGTFMTIKLVLTGLMLVVLSLTLVVGKFLFNISFYDSTSEKVVLIFIYYYIFSNIVQIPLTTFQATKEIFKRQIIMVSENLVKVPLFIYVAIMGASVIAVEGLNNWVDLLAITYLCGIFASCIVGFYLLRNYPLERPTKKMFKSYFIFAIPVMLLALINTISVNVDKIMIGYFWTSVEVGYYFTVQQVLQIVLIFSSAIGIVLFPTISEYHVKHNHKHIRKTIHMATRYISMLMMPVFITIVIFVNPIISIMLNDAFLPASGVLIVLTVLAFLTTIGTPYNSLIVGMNRPGIAAKIGLVMCVSNVILNFSFIPKDGLLSFVGINGALGASVATTISCVIGFISLCVVSKRLAKIKIFQRYYINHAIAGVLLAGFLYLAKINNPITWYTLILFVGMGLFVYFGILYLLKEFTEDDFKFFLDICHPKKMLEYMSGEIKK